MVVRAPQTFFCLLPALQFHGLTTQLPRQVWIALPQGRHAPKMDYPTVKLIQYSGDGLTKGIETHCIDQVDTAQLKSVQCSTVNSAVPAYESRANFTPSSRQNGFARS